MATRTLEIDLRQGTGASSEPMYGVVTVQRAKAKSAGGFEILPFETSLKLINGKATITEAETDGTGPLYDSAYLFRVQNGYCGQRYGFMAALPDGTTPITTGEMPMVNPLTGEGIYMDAQEWNELYGDLPDRVSSLETGKANTSHTHAIGDVTGLQTALNTKGNATMRVDNTVGTRVFITDGVTERMVSGDTGARSIIGVFADATSGLAILRRHGNIVSLSIANLQFTDPSASLARSYSDLTPVGFRITSSSRYALSSGINATGTMTLNSSGSAVIQKGTSAPLYHSFVWTTNDAWPTTLPGTPA